MNTVLNPEEKTLRGLQFLDRGSIIMHYRECLCLGDYLNKCLHPTQPAIWEYPLIRNADQAPTPRVAVIEAALKIPPHRCHPYTIQERTVTTPWRDSLYKHRTLSAPCPKQVLPWRSGTKICCAGAWSCNCYGTTGILSPSPYQDLSDHTELISVSSIDGLTIPICSCYRPDPGTTSKSSPWCTSLPWSCQCVWQDTRHTLSNREMSWSKDFLRSPGHWLRLMPPLAYNSTMNFYHFLQALSGDIISNAPSRPLSHHNIDHYIEDVGW